MKDNDLLSLIKDFSALEQVDAIALAGSHTTKWSNLRSSEILYDEEGRLAELQSKYGLEYSKDLATAIIAKNLPLLCNASPA